MEQEQLISILESILFTSGRPLKTKDLAKILEMEEPAIREALTAMLDIKKNQGIVVLENNGEYQLATNSKYSGYVKNFLNAELREKLTDATVEVLAIIAYRQPISKAEIEAIRGVNSQYSLRNLLIRGLIEKIQNPGDARSFLYQTTTEFLMHLGILSVKELPEFEKLVENIKLPQTAALQNQAIAETKQPTDGLPVELAHSTPEQEQIVNAANQPASEDEESDADEDEDEDDEDEE